MNIVYSPKFKKRLEHLPEHLRTSVDEKIRLLASSPMHPSLRLHKLGGKLDGHYSISLNLKYRIVFKPFSNGDILLVSVGNHDIYRFFLII
jgi:plasmid maintenance system killer protein